ncbi:hypothetical protein [Methylopila sp. 73B]|uniref:hypothetical protein n=1 Tax=Methylopila sp. 73B TaxID=1120792 RepID=UPI00035F8737|nr:hypothetical protein [Methylopila sp. 73B]
MTKRPASKRATEGQGDLFVQAADLFPVRRPETGPRAVDLSVRVKTAMGQALKECPDSATVVAARMTEISGREITADALYTYTAPSKEHDMGIVRFVAFVRATGATWLWDLLVEDDGLVVLEGREAKLAQLGYVEQEQQRLQALSREIRKTLQKEPVSVAVRARRGRR